MVEAAVGQAMHVAEQLRIDANPFVPRRGGGRIGRPLQQALGEVIRHIGLETPIVAVAGNAGTGKTLLANMAARACSEMGLSVRRVDRGDLVDGAAGEWSDVLLADEADSMMDSTLRMLRPDAGKRVSTTTVLLCRPASLRRFHSIADAAVVELASLSPSDTRSYLLERANSVGGSDLFAPEALDLIVDGSRGVPRSLWSIASLAFFSAASDGSSQIGRQHAADALASHFILPETPNAATPATPPGALAVVTEMKSSQLAPSLDSPDESLQMGLQRVADALTSQMPSPEAPEAAAATAPLDTPPVETGHETAEQPAASYPADDSLQISLQLLADAPASQFVFPEPEDAVPTDTPSEVPSVATAIEEPEDAPASDAPSLDVVRARLGIEGNAARRPSIASWRMVGGAMALAASLAVAAAIPAFLLFDKHTGATALDSPPVKGPDVPRPLVAAPANPIPPVTPSTTVANGAPAAKPAAGQGDAAKTTAARSAPATQAAGQASTSAKPADQTNGVRQAAVQAPPAIDTAAEKPAAKEPPAQAVATIDIGNQATISAEAAAEATAAQNEPAQPAPAQQAGDPAGAAREAAAQTQAAALRAKIAEDAANRVKAAMQVAAQAAARAKAEAEFAKELAERDRRQFRNSLLGVHE